MGGILRRRYSFNILFAILLILVMTLGIHTSNRVQANMDSSPHPLPATWIPLPHQGLDNLTNNAWVRGMIMVGSDLYVGGSFTQTSGGAVTNLNAIARLDTTANTWHPLGNNGLTDPVNPLPQARSFALVGTDLYVSGYFDRTADGAVTGLNNIARYDLSAGTWHALSNGGLDAPAAEMVVIGNDIYMVGSFSSTFDGTVTLNKVARYNTTAPGTWFPLANNGLDGGVSASTMIQYGNSLFVGGSITKTFDGTVTNLNGIARYDLTTSTWSALANEGLNGAVEGLAVIGSDLYAGGAFNFTHDLTIGNLVNVARYDMSGDSWHPLANNGVNGGATVHTVSAVGNILYVGGGVLTQTNDGVVTDLNNIAQYDTLTSTWSALPNQGLFDATNAGIFTIIPGGTGLYVAGRFTRTFDSAIDPMVNIAMLGGDTPPNVVGFSPSGVTTASTTSMTVIFDEDVRDPAGDADPHDVTNPANYLLILKGLDGLYNTVACNPGLAGDDISIPIGPVSYDAVTYTATVTVNGGAALAVGEYRAFVCGTTSIRDYFNNPLGGGADYIGDFTITVGPAGVTKPPAEGEPSALPITGFPPGIVTKLPEQSPEMQYSQYEDLILEIPETGMRLPIVGVPRDGDSWDVSWLDGEAGWLEGTAFPTWAGNTVLTAHVWDADNLPGPFYGIKDLAFGDILKIQGWGETFTYEVRKNYLASPGNTASVLQHETFDWLTLVTCEAYDTYSSRYDLRRIVRAVLVSME